MYGVRVWILSSEEHIQTIRNSFPVERSQTSTMKLMLTDRIFCSAVIFLQCSICVLSLDSTALDDAVAQQTSNASPAKKYRKKLRKEEGAIRLVGGSNDYEGKWLLRFTYKHFFFFIHFIYICIKQVLPFSLESSGTTVASNHKSIVKTRLKLSVEASIWFITTNTRERKKKENCVISSSLWHIDFNFPRCWITWFPHFPAAEKVINFKRILDERIAVGNG